MIYTKKGDDGTTRFNPRESRVSKADDITHMSGAIDEWNAYMGHCIALCTESGVAGEIKPVLVEIQKLIFECGAKLFDPDFQLSDTSILTMKLENYIDEQQIKLPKLNQFVFFNQDVSVSQMNLCRVRIRQIERFLVEYSPNFIWINSVLPLINRLSDAIFIIQRVLYHDLKIKEKRWNSEE